MVLQLLLEATIVGIVITVIGYFVSLLIKLILKPTVPTSNWNKYHVMEISLFITGFIAHILFELSGMNKKYCKVGYACKK